MCSQRTSMYMFKVFSSVKNCHDDYHQGIWRDPLSGQQISKNLETKLVRELSKDQRMTAKTLANHLAKSGTDVSTKMVSRGPHYNGLWGCKAIKKKKKNPLLKKRHLQATLKFKGQPGKDYTYWKLVLWSDVTKAQLSGHRDVAYVWRKKGEALNSNTAVGVQCYGDDSVHFSTRKTTTRLWKTTSGNLQQNMIVSSSQITI